MKIESSAVVLAASHRQTEYNQETERLDVWRGRPVTQEDRGSPGIRARGPGRGLALGHHRHHAHRHDDGDRLALSDKARSLHVRKGELDGDDLGEGMTPADSFRTTLMKRMVEMFTGRSIKTIDPSELEPDDDKTQDIEDVAKRHRPDRRRGSGFGLRYEYRETHYESEQMSFSAQGVAQTADGREISFNVELNMSREFYSETAVTFEAGRKLKDPLVMNFDGNAVELTERDFAFDIDLDGHEDQIAFVGEGSGFLALDKNEDGEINDGGELFGPTTGDGFAELAEYDSDQNNWIDENDPIYADLRIWSRAADGTTSLLALGQRGVGAIYLGRIESPFMVKDDNNEALGEVRSSGIFLDEDGGTGTLQQLDLVV